MKTKKNKKTKVIFRRTPIAPTPLPVNAHAHRRHLPYHWLLLGLLLALNAVLCYPLLFDGHSRFIESIENAHLANANYLLQHWGANWNNLWYYGFPPHLTYPPLVPALIALISKLFSLPISHSYRLIVGIFVWLTPLSLYAFTFFLTGKKTTAFLATLMYMVLPSVAYLFIPQIVPNVTLAGWAPYQWVIFSQYGEGPHLVSLFFSPLAALFFIKSYRQPDIKNYLLAALFIALTMLSNLFGGFALIVIVFIVVLGKMAVYLFGFNFRRFFIITIFAYALTAFAFDLNFIDSIMQSSYIHPENTMHLPPFLAIFLFCMIVLLPGSLFLRHKMMGKDDYFSWFIISIWIIVFLGAGVVYYHTGYSLMSQPNRYLPEAQIGFVILLAMIINHFLSKYRQGQIQWKKYLLIKGIALTVIFLLSYSYLSKPHYLIDPQNMNNTHEQEIAEWLDKNLDKTNGERAYLTGTPAFWLTALKPDIPQIRGGADNAQPNPWWADITYFINKNEDELLTKAWLSILNIKYVLVNYPESGTHYVDFENLDRFKEWPTIQEFADGGFQLKTIPDNFPSLFNVVDFSKDPTLGRLNKVTERESVLKFANAINKDQTDRVQYSIKDTDHFQVTVKNLNQDESIIFRMNYDQRWSAVANNTTLKITKTGPNFMLVKPNTNGDITIDFTCSRLWTEYLGSAISILAVVLMFWFFIKRKEKLID